jgi:transglutaminase-like putative cysteine protease
MKKTLLSLSILASVSSYAQDYIKLAKDFQQQYKDSEAVILQSGITYSIAKDSKTGAKVTENKTEKILSLRYNYPIYRSEVYNQNSTIGEFYAQSNLKQKAPDNVKACGTYTQEGLFYDDSKFCTHVLKLKEIGEVWDVTLEKNINDAKYLTTIFFQEKYPVKEKKIAFVIPHDIEVEIKEYNFSEASISKSTKKDGSSTFIEYSVKDLPAMEDENYERGVQYNLPHLLVLVKSYMQGGKKINIMSTPQDLYTWYSSLTKQLRPNTNTLKPLVTDLIKNKKSDVDKIKAIYYWVQDNVRYIAFEDGIAGYKPDEAHLVYEKRYGDCKGMANLTKEMLKIAGYDARLTWIGTKRILYDQTIPSLAVNNHMICTVFLGEKKYYLDATEKYMPFGENAERIQNRSVMIEDGEKFIMDKVAHSETPNTDQRKFVARINGETLEGKYKIDLRGEAKKNFLYSYHFTKSERKEDFINDFIGMGNKNTKISNVTIPNMEERSGSLALQCDVNLTGALSSFNNEFYIDLDQVKNFKKMDVQESRQSDIDFGEKVNKNTMIELEIPDGYNVSYLPEKLSISDPEFSFHIQYTLQGNRILYTKELKITDGIIRKKSFTRWNAAIKQLAEAYESQIVLKKK